ncbi:ABC transporter substrate-binding protein [Conexibacter sp. CPCC 206217]|uniref:ABC transporter substrate-binding protein n=1 Tax=Conexibacter sp. CPCC 206217 TaxID=3064574 RepID=UPI0027173833|nr:extracellular solute-binding protein [Conexibacter sp. CPCC 206217]MDO8211054.1 extracellular solute-binding protein [Conexibacter sp. CPCC 206217]
MRRDLWGGRAPAAGRTGRRVAALLLAAAVSVGVAACGSSSDSDGGTTASSGSASSGTLKVAFPATAQAGWQKVIDDFKAANPDVDVKATFAPFASFFQLVSTQLQANAGPDVFYVPPGSSLALSLQNAAARGIIANLDDRPWAKDVSGAYRDVVSHDGSVYALVNGVFTSFMLTNEDKFRELGLNPPATMDELMSMCETITDKGLTPVAIGGGFPPDLVNLMGMLLPNYVDGPDPQWIRQRNADRTTFAESKGWRTALQRIVDLKEAGCFDSGVAGTSREAATARFASGKALMYPIIQPQLATVLAAKPTFDWSVAPLPGDGPDTTFLSVQVDPLVAMNAKSKNRALAEQFIDFVATLDGSRAYNEVQQTVAPADFEAGTFPEFMAPLSANLEPGGNNVVGQPNDWKSASTNATLSTDLAGLLTGQKTVDDILADLDSTYGR